MLYRVEGLLIRHTDYGEGDKIITIFTESYGKIGIMARGARKMNSRHAAAVQLFTYGEFVFYRIGRQLGSLNSAEPIESHRKLREDVYLSAYAAYLSELTDRLIGDQEPQPALYRELKAAFDCLSGEKDPQIIAHIYEMKALAVAGYAPILDRCAGCGELTDHPVVGYRAGGILCPRCAARDADSVEVGEGVLKLLRLLAKVDLERIGKIGLKQETKNVLKQVMRNWLDTHTGIRWRSLQVLEQMEKYDV